MTITTRGLFWLAVTACLPACTQVEFQSPPSLPLAACDPALVGDWRVEDPKDDEASSERIYLRVSADCTRWLGIEVDQDAEEGSKLKVDDLKNEMNLGFARSAEQTFVVSQDKPKAAAEETAATDPGPDDADKPPGYVLVGYASEGDAVVFRLIDPQRAAHLIIDDEIPGWIEKRDRATDGSVDVMSRRFSVYVFGNADATDALLQAHELLGPPWLRLLKADPVTQAAMDSWIEQAAEAATAEAAEEGS